MLSAVVEGLASLMTPETIIWLFAGVIVGLAVGIFPGVGGLFALAVAIPLTFGMDPTTAFVFLVAIIATDGTTGDITSIVLGVPGDPSAAATVVDGYPMTKQGKAGQALGASLSASAFAGLFAAVVIVICLFIFRPIALALGSPEFFMLIVVGLTFVATLGRGAMLKSIIMALAGLLLSTVGLDPQGGVPRFTFGQLVLWDGVGIVPVALGLFAIPELLDLAVRKTSIASGGIAIKGSILEGVRETWRHKWLTIRCSAIGAFVGMMPGLGLSVSQWVGYAHAVQSSPRYDDKGQERFGRGAIEGVIGPSAVNNSGIAGTLVPTLALGIPGSAGAALILAALVIHGIRPGPDMLTVHLDLTMSLAWVIIIGNLIAVAIAFAFLRPIIKLTQIRAGLMIPPILLLVFVGAYAEQGQMMDVVIMLVFGALAIFMTSLNWPRPPLVLGLVLGGLAENFFFRSVGRYEYDWLTFPSVIGLSLVALGSVWYALRQGTKDRRLRAAIIPGAAEAESE